MLSKEEIEEAKERISKGIEDVCFSTLYSQEENEADEKILLQYIKELEISNKELNKENDRLEKIEFERDDTNNKIKKLKDKLEILKDELEKYGYTGYADDVKEILEIIGGENEQCL